MNVFKEGFEKELKGECGKCGADVPFKFDDVTRGRVVNCPNCGEEIIFTDKSGGLRKLEKSFNELDKSMKSLFK